MNRRLRTILILLGLFAAAWIPRVLALDEFVTIDERKWLARSANFYDAVAQGNPADTFQREHPGVTVMWAGTLGLLRKYPAYPAETPGQFAWNREFFEAWLDETGGPDPLALLAAGRWWIVLAISLTIAAAYFPLRALFGEVAAAFSALYLAWTPFYLSLSRQLHPEGLVASLTFLALLFFLAWLYAEAKPRYLVASGAVMGLAWLTKTPAIFLVPTAAVLIVLEWLRQRRTLYLPGQPDPRSVRAWIVAFVVWGLIATGVFVLLWPAMWADPVGTLGRMLREMGVYVERHTNANYFLGRPVEDPGPLFYPIAYLFRSSPVTWIGLIAAAVFWRTRQLPFEMVRVRQTAGSLLIFALIFTIGMTVGAKKFDRYILPTFLALDIVAVTGWWGVAFWARRQWPERMWTQRALLPVWILGGAVLVHGLLGFAHFPYYLTYYNPLVGGPWTAPQVLFVGWGEGLDRAAAYLNEQPDAEDLRVAAWYHDGPFSYFFDGSETAISSDSPLFWLEADYAVLYVNQWQRQSPSPGAIDYFFAQEPEHIVRRGGVELARVYDLRDRTIPDFVEIGKESAADFGDQIRLAAYDFDTLEAPPGDVVRATFYLQSLAPMDVDYNTKVRVVGENGQEIWQADGWPWGAPTSDWPVRDIRPDGHMIVIPEETPPGLYQVNLSFYDPATVEHLPVTDSETGELLDERERRVALLRVGASPEPADPLDEPAIFDERIALTGATLPATAAAGDALPVRLFWESLAPTSTDYTVFAHVVSADGQQVAGQDRPPRDGFAATHLWQPGQRITDELSLLLPADLAPGTYEVRVGLYTLDAGRLPIVAQGEIAGDYAVIGRVEIP